jgi:hypothetical protein
VQVDVMQGEHVLRQVDPCPGTYRERRGWQVYGVNEPVRFQVHVSMGQRDRQRFGDGSFGPPTAVEICNAQQGVPGRAL